MTAQPKIIVNRAGNIVDAAFTKIAGKLLFFSYLRPFSYWDNYYGEHAEITNDFFRLLHYPTIQEHDDKGNIARKVTALGIDGLFPATYFSTSDALKSAGAHEKIWFIKPTYSTSGKGIQCLTHEELKTFELPRSHIIQEQVTNIELMNERKYTARAYVFVFNNKVYLYDDGFVMIHGVPYAPNATDSLTQVEHSGYADPDGAVKMMRMSELPHFSKKTEKLKKAMQTLKPVIANFIEASSATEYGLLGIDLLFDKNHKPTLIEINAKANFVHTELINSSLNVPFFAAVLNTLYTNQTDPRLTEL
ncbi:tubulin--tyrosine ligase family protein [Pseudidiomarina homiensis]|uniref:tubulin--tyrosine ligase family protein n=1 Tax=Pseudidiomarina homiensis TaxID=364198 RepID=UPI00215A34C2|nr:tubulin--tyrosine ligase family protein [Pseudidiomarina homiensis]